MKKGKDILNRRPGVCINENGKVDIRLWAPLATGVSINVNKEKTFPLTRENFGYWCGGGGEIKEGDRYKFILDKGNELPDPASLFQPEGVHGPSEVVDLNNFQWTDEEWNNLALEDYIIYELHTGTFTNEGTFSGIESKLDYLQNLGITAIEIMPVAQFPGNRNWGYDGVFPYAVQNSYGGARGLQHLVNACHKKGIAVVLDVVYNHLGPEGNYLGSFGPYFTSKYNTPWGGAINFDDEWCDGVREYFIQNALMWFYDFHIDALRLDAVHAIKDFSPLHILKDIKLHLDELMKSTGTRHYLIVESDLNDNRFINKVENGGYGMDAQWIDEFHHALRVTASGEKQGYYSDFNGIEHLAKAFKDAYVYDGQWSPHRKKRFGIKAENNPGSQFIVFSQNHDQVGNRMLGERTSKLVNFEMLKVLAAAVLLSPYLPMLFMGEEWGEPNPFLYFVSHSDQELVAAVRKGRKEEFAAFHISGEAPDPFAESTFELSKPEWNIINEKKHAALLAYYKELILIRKKHPVIQSTDRKQIDVACNEETKTMTIRRWNNTQQVLMMMNFSGNPQSYNIEGDSEVWKKILDSTLPRWNEGGETTPEKQIVKDKITLSPESVVVYEMPVNSARYY